MMGSSEHDKVLLAIKAAQHKDLPELIRRIEEAWHTDLVSPLDAARHLDIYELATEIILDISAGLQGSVLQPLGVTDIPPIYAQGAPWVEPASTPKIILIKNDKSIDYTAQAFYYDSNEAISDPFPIPKKDWVFFMPMSPSVKEYEIGEERVKLRIEKGDLTRLNDQLVLMATINNTVMALLHIVELFLSLPISKEILETLKPNIHKFATFWQSKLKIAAAFMKEPSVPNAIEAMATVLADKEIQELLLEMIMDIFKEGIEDPDAFFKHAGKMLSNYAIVLKIVNIPEKVAFFYDLLTAPGNIVYNLQWPRRLTYIPEVRIIEPSNTSISWAAPTTIQFKCTGEDLDSGTTSLTYVWEAYNKTTGAKTSIGTGSSISYRFEDPGDYTVTVTATDKDGAWAKDSINIKIRANQIPIAITGQATNVTATSATLNAMVNPNGLATSAYFEWGTSTSYENRTPTQSIGSGTSNINVSANLTGLSPNTTYHFRVVAQNSAGISYGSNVSFETSAPPPNQSPVTRIISPPDGSLFTQGQLITFQGEAIDPEDGRLTGSSLVWRSSRDGVIGFGESFTKSDLSVGTHTITLIATDSKGAIGQDSISITINRRPNQLPVAVIRALPTTGEVPLTVSFDASQSYDPDGSIVSYSWNFGDGTTGTGIVTSHTYSSVGTFAASLTVTDNEGATGADSITITVSPHTIIPTSLSINIDPSSIPENTGMNIKISGRLTRRDTGQGIGGKQIGVVFHTITMIRGAITDSNGYYQTEYPVPGVLPAGSYEFRAYFEGDSQYARSEARVFLTINPTANLPPVAVINASPTTGNAPLTVNFDGSASYDPDGHIISYEWSFGDRTFGSGAIVSHTYNDPSPYPYTVVLTVTDDKGATGSSSVTIYVTSAPSRRANIVIRASPNPVSIFPNDSEQVTYYFQETNGVGAIINSRVWEWIFIDGTSCCSGAAVNIVPIEGFSSTTWSDSIYLPEEIAWRAYEKGEPYRVILRTTFHVLDDNGNSFDITFDLLVDIILL